MANYYAAATDAQGRLTAPSVLAQIDARAVAATDDIRATVADLGVVTNKETLARNHVMDPLFKGNGWTGWQGRQTWTVADGTATVKTNVETGIGNPLFEGVATVGQAAPAKDGDVWSMSVVVGVPASAPGPLTLRAGVAYGPASPTTLSYSHTQTVAPGESKTFTVQNNATPAGRTTAFVTVRSGQVIPAGSVMTVSKPVLTKGPTVGAFIHGDMPDAGEMSWSWEGAPHSSASVQTRTTVNRPAVLDFVRDPATGDMHKGGEVIVTNDNAARVLAGMIDVPETVPRGEAAVRTYLSLDYGRTFKVIFNLHDWVTTKGGRAHSDMQHLHGVAWDPYWDRIWLTYGDGMGGKGSNGVIFSDDLGASWQFAHHTPEGSTSSFQCVGILPMPRCVLMFGDTTPAVMRIDRAHGKHTGTYPVDVAHDSTAAGSPKHLCQGFYRGRREGDDAPLLAAFSTEGGVGQDFIVATLDGWKFEEVWRGTPTTPAGWGVRNPVGPTIRGQFLAATNANGGTTGQWATIRIPATGY